MAPLGRPVQDPGALTAGRIGLRVVRPGDAKVLQQLLSQNRSWLTQWEATHPSGNSIVPGSVSMRPTIKLMRRQLRAGTGVPFVMTLDGVVVGQLSVSEMSGGALQSAQIGYWVSEHAAGNGVTPTCVALAIDYLFTQVRLHRVEICIRPENAPSLRVVEKLGLRHEGRREAYIHIDGKWRAHECFAITSDEVQGRMLTRLAVVT